MICAAVELKQWYRLNRSFITCLELLQGTYQVQEREINTTQEKKLGRKEVSVEDFQH